MITPSTCRSRAFSLIELLVVIAIVALLTSILLPALADARRTARQAVCGSNLRQMGVGFESYAVDYRGRLASYTWTPGVRLSQWSILNELGAASALTNMKASANQAVDIMRRRSGRTDIYSRDNWGPQFLYTHLVLLDYLGEAMPNRMVACPEDGILINWQRDLKTLNPKPWGLDPLSAEATHLHYSASYSVTISQFAMDRSQGGLATAFPNPDNHISAYIGSLPLGTRKQSDVAFPAQKVLMFAKIARHHKLASFYGYPDTSQPLLFFDGSVQNVRTKNVNRGFNPNEPDNKSPVIISYAPNLTTEPPTRSGRGADPLYGYYRWTREGLKGIDIGGQERGLTK